VSERALRTTPTPRTVSGETLARCGALERCGLWLSEHTAYWCPDAFSFALLAILVTYLVGLGLGESPGRLIFAGGESFWLMAPFTMQMAMIVIGGYALATSPPVHRLICILARIPRTGRAAVAFVALFSMVTALLSWGFSLIFSGLLVRELARRLEDMDYRAAGAAGYLGLGSVWALGLSSSAALMMATPSSIPRPLLALSGLIPLTQSLFTLPSFILVVSLVGVSIAVAYWSAPSPGRARTAKQMGVVFESLEVSIPPRTTPGEWLMYSPIVTVGVAGFFGLYIVQVFRRLGFLGGLDLNMCNLVFIVLALLFHWQPKRFLLTVARAVPKTGPVLIQFPFYAVVFGMIAGTRISEWATHGLILLSSHNTYSLLVAGYTIVLGIFVPSGGSKWIIEAPSLLTAAVQHKIHLGWVVQIYNAAEAIPNLLNPFWMLPLLATLRIKARDLVGYSMLQMIAHIPVVLLLAWLFARYLPFVAPIK